MNNYVFIRVVGKGSYGEVNLVKHRADRKQVRTKAINLYIYTFRIIAHLASARCEYDKQHALLADISQTGQKLE